MGWKNTITFDRFLVVNSKLIQISNTWSDLWTMIFYTGLSVGRIIELRYEDIDIKSVLLKGKVRFRTIQVDLNPALLTMLMHRRENYPDDIFVFQSHSNRVKNKCRPVTVIAFNAALRHAGQYLLGAKVSSTNARRIEI